jgi:hypothetical protein
MDLIDSRAASYRVVPVERGHDVFVIASHQGVRPVRSDELERERGKESAIFHEHAVCGAGKRDQLIESGWDDAHLVDEIRTELDHVESGCIGQDVLAVPETKK